MRNGEDAASQERQALKRHASVRSKKGSAWDLVDGKVVILRSIFSVHYPKLLVEVTTDLDDSMTQSMREVGHTSVDISFKDLSLAVQVAGQQINVVDHVTGRLQAKTMTALMGGSGCGTIFVEFHCCRLSDNIVKKGSIKKSSHLAPDLLLPRLLT
jgi:hypothetical protein